MQITVRQLKKLIREMIEEHSWQKSGRKSLKEEHYLDFLKKRFNVPYTRFLSGSRPKAPNRLSNMPKGTLAVDKDGGWGND